MAAKFVFALVLVALALSHAEEPKVLAGLVPEAKVPEAVSEMIEAVSREKREAGDDEADEADEEEADDGDWEPEDEYDEDLEADNAAAADEEADADYLDEDDEESADEWQLVEDPAEDATAK